MLTGTYLLESCKEKFNIDGAVEATCPLCCLEDEDIGHMLLRTVSSPAVSETSIDLASETESIFCNCPKTTTERPMVLNLLPKVTACLIGNSFVW